MPFNVKIVIPNSEAAPTPAIESEDPDAPAPSALEQIIKSSEVSLEDSIRKVFQDLNISCDTWTLTTNKKSHKIEFIVLDGEALDEVLEQLSFYNVGKVDGSLIIVTESTASIIPSQKAAQTENDDDVSVSAFKKFIKTLKSRLTVAQVYDAISRRGDFTVDYLAFIICASVLADVALVTNRAPVLFASMLLSPMMDPILCILFGSRLREKRLIVKGVRNTFASIGICLAVGLICGVVTHAIADFEIVTPYPTVEITSRGQARYLPSTAVITFFSGVSTAFAILNNAVSAMIGNAISLSILPPAVNSGHLIFLSLMSLATKGEHLKSSISLSDNKTMIDTCPYPWARQYTMIYFDTQCQFPQEFIVEAVFSLMVTIINIVFILAIGYIVCIIKEIAPSSFMAEETRKFYKEDMKEARDADKTIRTTDKVAQNAFDEYRKIVNLDASRQDEKEQLVNDFEAVMETLQDDKHLKTISAASGARLNLHKTVRRFSVHDNVPDPLMSPSMKPRFSFGEGLQRNGSLPMSPIPQEAAALPTVDERCYETLTSLRGVKGRLKPQDQNRRRQKMASIVEDIANDTDETLTNVRSPRAGKRRSLLGERRSLLAAYAQGNTGRQNKFQVSVAKET